ncbi:MAG: Protein phosphatase methylesterase 1 [Thelocarpon superellum]|nr:MAG: Protein phosphatase methylesterase 1 [Thelocarpon superellum]
MSDLHRSFAKAKLAQLPPMPPDIDEAAEEEQLRDPTLDRDYDDSSSASSASSTGTIRPAPSHHLFPRPKIPLQGGRRSHLDPLPWTPHFAQELYLTASSNAEDVTHHVYLTAPAPAPALAPALSAPLFVTHHGAGSSGLSFAILASEIRKLLPNAGVLSVDARGHGESVVTPHGLEPAKSLDLSLETLTTDLITILRLTQEKCAWPSLPPLVLVGHSLGGAVVTNAAHRGTLGDRVLAYAVLDVVEGSAMDALQSMQTYLTTRPSTFPSLSVGIEWHIRSRTIRNTTSARTSVPPLLTQSVQPPNAWLWRTDLAATQPFWESWFRGLSSKFLGATSGKLLLLAGTDRLDKELMIGQMQGKYQLQVFPEAGHFIHEDLPEKTAMVLVDFYKRNDRSALVLPPKVGDLLKMKPSPSVLSNRTYQQ